MTFQASLEELGGRCPPWGLNRLSQVFHWDFTLQFPVWSNRSALNSVILSGYLIDKQDLWTFLIPLEGGKLLFYFHRLNSNILCWISQMFYSHFPLEHWIIQTISVCSPSILQETPLQFRVTTQLHMVRKISFLNCFALKPLLQACCYTTLSSSIHISRSCLSYFCAYTHKSIFSQECTNWDNTPLEPGQAHTILLPTPAPTKSRLSSQLSLDSNCQQQPRVSSSLHPLMSSDKLQREPHLPVTFYLLHFTSQAHAAQHKNSTVTQAVCRKYPAQAAKAQHSVCGTTHSK